MKHVFIRIEEGSEGEEKALSCLLLSGDHAQEFIENPTKFLEEYNNAKLLGSWVVPEDLQNATASDSVREAFDALLALNDLSDFPVVSDLFATIFEAGYQLANNKEGRMSRKRRPDGSVDEWGWSDAEGNPMVTLSDLMTSKSHIPDEDEQESVFEGGGVRGTPYGSYVPSNDDIHARRRRRGL